MKPIAFSIFVVLLTKFASSETPIDTPERPCMVQGQLVQHGQAISTSQCNACKCVFGATICTERPTCDPDTSARCKFGENLYIPVGEFRQSDRRECQCLETGQLRCEKKGSCQLEDGRVVSNGQSEKVDCNTCSCSNGRLICTKKFCFTEDPEVRYKDCQVDDMMIQNGQSHGDCVCIEGNLVCKEVNQNKRSCGTLDDGRMVFIGSTVRTADGRDCTCSDSGSFITCTSDKTCEFQGRRVPVGQITNSCFCMYTGMVQCTSSGFVGGGGGWTDQIGGVSGSSFGMFQEGSAMGMSGSSQEAFSASSPFKDSVTTSNPGTKIGADSSSRVCIYNSRTYSVGQIDDRCSCLNSGQVVCSGVLDPDVDINKAGLNTKFGADSSSRVCGTLSDGRQVREGEVVTDTNGQTCKCGDSGNYLECYSTDTVCLYDGRIHPVGQIDDRCSCLNSGQVVCSGVLDPVVDINKSGLNTKFVADSSSRVCIYNSRTYSVGQIDDRCSCLNSGQVVCSGVLDPVVDMNTSGLNTKFGADSSSRVCIYNSRTYSVGQIDDRCSCLNSGQVVCSGVLDPVADIKKTSDSKSDEVQIGGQVEALSATGTDIQGYNDGSCQMGDIMYYNGQFIGYGQGTEKCLCQNGRISCSEDTSEGCPLDSGALLPEGQSVQMSLYTCLCKNKRLICSLSRSCSYLGTEIANGQVIMNNGQKCVCLENKMMCYPVGSCFQGGRVLTEGQSVVSGTGQYCTCSNGELSCAVTEVYCEVGSVGGGGRLEVGEVITLGGEDCSCTRTGLECSKTASECEFSVPSGETYRLARNAQKIIPGVGKCTCKADGPMCLQGCFLRDIELEEGETAMSDGKICTCSSNKLTCRAGYTCYIEGDVTLLTGQRSGRCRCGAGELSCEGLAGWEVQAACVSNDMVVQEGVTVPYRCGFCKCSRGVLGCYQVHC
ncbi:hypothetical protein ACHWQZ_G013791 [Mnemiopsis leidyi]